MREEFAVVGILLAMALLGGVGLYCGLLIYRRFSKRLSMLRRKLYLLGYVIGVVPLALLYWWYVTEKLKVIDNVYVSVILTLFCVFLVFLIPSLVACTLLGGFGARRSEEPDHGQS